MMSICSSGRHLLKAEGGIKNRSLRLNWRSRTDSLCGRLQPQRRSPPE
ncbi:hypothetical protein HMPREF9413_5830 [Paenibacillus sp. HGF7]|nr:hypothetical protein HMPREF9413_5830 [Paenibacillus sp. HGF7]